MCTATGADESAIPLMRNRDGGLRYFKCFKFNKTVTSFQKTAKPSPQLHTHDHREGEKWSLSERPSGSLFLQHETKWKSMWGPARIFWQVLLRVSCILHVKPSVRVQNAHAALFRVEPQNRLLVIPCLCVGLCEMCIVCFLHFPFPSLLLFSVMSPTVSLPTRPASLDLSHEEATFWLHWCVLKNPFLNSVDPPAT